MKKLLLLAFTMAALLVSPDFGRAAATELRMNITTAETSVWFVAAREFKRIVEEKTEGRYRVSLFGNEQLSGGDLVKGVEMIFTGVTDLDIHSTINMTGFEPKLTICTMPWIFPGGYASVDETFFNGPGSAYFKELIEKKNVKVLGFGENGFRQVTNNVREIRSPADMRQLKIRTPPIAMYVDLFKLFGADPTVMSFAEVFTALQQGTIDGQENPLDTIRAAKIQEVQKHISLWNYSWDPIALSVSNKVWNRLSDADKQVFLEAGAIACKMQVEASRALDKQNLELFGKTMKIAELTPEEVKAFQEAAAPIYQSYKDKIGADAFKAFGYEMK
ncbi:MAG: DctP family TRAP transporter solute-binding subunit [Deltaproteobacteria bacterium]|jgi:tripartite ATP-independent transporter DctP family solute receptor|nr:DctP family TRAP transporter solute-binding subunit [Deltaproteobacteria bacterium]